MRVLVTGAAGFIGSTLVDALLAEGHHVLGVDCFTTYYPATAKHANLHSARSNPHFDLADVDLLTADLDPLFDGVEVVFHQAGQPGVRLSWADEFRTYADLNVVVTQRVLEAARRHHGVRVVYASSSSVYGNATTVPTDETQPTRPYSPYGVTKLAGEMLCNAYAANFGVESVILRYFTVYGPRQRPDMATHRLIEAAIDGTPFPLFGDGRQVRDFTFVDDIVRANLLAGTSPAAPGAVCNIAGGGSVELVELVRLVGAAVGNEVRIDWREQQAGDVARTGGAIAVAERVLGWHPEVDIASGVQRQVAWHLARRRT